MKKTFCLLSLTVALCAASVAAHATVKTDTIPSKEAIAAMTPQERQAHVEQIKTRIAEIKALDRSQMTRADRKAYRAELKNLKDETKVYDVLYVGIGALVIVIILLLILL